MMVLYISREVRAFVVLRIDNLQVANTFNDSTTGSGTFDATGCDAMTVTWRCWRGLSAESGAREVSGN